MSLLNCAISAVSLSCLGILAVILFGIILFQKTNKNPADVDNDKPSQKYSHLLPGSKSKPVESVVALMSDSENDWEVLSKVVDSLDKNIVPNAFIVGDITQLGVLDDLREAKRITENTSVKFYYLPGDRDLWKSSGIANFKTVLGPNYQMVKVGSANFLLIDNSNEYEGIDDEQWKFIEANMPNADYVLLHNPVYFNDSVLGLIHHGMGQYSDDVEAQRVRLVDLIRKSHVKAVFSGDQHLFSETTDSEKSSLNYYVLGALNTARNIQQPNYILLTLYTDGDYHVEQVYLTPSP